MPDASMVLLVGSFGAMSAARRKCARTLWFSEIVVSPLDRDPFCSVRSNDGLDQFVYSMNGVRGVFTVAVAVRLFWKNSPSPWQLAGEF